MSQLKNPKNTAGYQNNIDIKCPQEHQINNNQSNALSEESPFNVSKILRAKQQQSNIFHLPQKNQIDFKAVSNLNAEKLLPYDIFWWNSQNVKNNKKSDQLNQQIQNSEIIQSRPQTGCQQRIQLEQIPNYSDLTEEQFLQMQQQQYQLFLQQHYQEQKHQSKSQEQQNLQQHNNQQLQKVQQKQQNQNTYQQQTNQNEIYENKEMMETASFHERPQSAQPKVQENKYIHQQKQEKQQFIKGEQKQISNQIQNSEKLYNKVNNPNIELKQRNPNFSDVLGNGLEKYYQQKPQQAQVRRTLQDQLQESELYGVKYHQRQLLKGMSSQMDTHKYYDQMLEQQNQHQIKQQQPKSSSKSPQNSPGKILEKDEKLFSKSVYTELTIRGMGKEVNWEKLTNQLNIYQMNIADIDVVKNKQGQIKQHKIIIKHLDSANLLDIKQWVITQGGRIVEEKLIKQEEFLRLQQQKEGSKQKPLKISEEKEKLKQKQKKRPASSLPNKIQRK
ncbi:unnamed protein product [Paramecium sonneborni]|uniref:Uncharacterized protein n=1 Tax=Paramecium sonneborni TaxID=65129 RepID=A0A8S1NF20_9CILI|nr:unnamed protein product [Paramecium sonneborni]